MSDPNQPPPYPGPQPPVNQPPPYGQQPQQPPPYGVPQYPTGPSYQQYAAPPPSRYAHWGYRFGGYLLDTLLPLPAYVAAGAGAEMYDDVSLSDSTQNAGLGIMVVGYLLGIGFQIWNGIIRQGRTGSSLGKQWVGIAVISEQTGTPIGGWRTFGRALLHILDALPCYLGYLWPLWDDKRQTFADKIMKTIVVKRVTAPPAYQPPYPPVNQPPYPPTYPPTYGSPQG